MDALPPLPEPEPLPPLSDADFARLDEPAIHAMRDHIAAGQRPMFAIQAPSHIDLARYSSLPVLLTRRIDNYRRWDVQPQLNFLVAISDLTTDQVAFQFPYATEKTVMPSGRSRYRDPPAPPFNTIYPFVDLTILPLGESAKGGRRIAVTALYFDWKSPTISTQLDGPAAPRVAEKPTEASWLITDPERLPPAPAAEEAFGMELQRGPDGSIRALGHIRISPGAASVAVTLLMLRKDDTTAHAQRIELALAPDGSARFLVNLTQTLTAGREPPEVVYLIAGSQVLGPYRAS